MKKFALLLVAVALFVGCQAKVDVKSGSDTVVVDTTLVDTAKKIDTTKKSSVMPSVKPMRHAPARRKFVKKTDSTKVVSKKVVKIDSTAKVVVKK